jgi:RsiW-degrading membrane proteinase PrsW (M82 family)
MTGFLFIVGRMFQRLILRRIEDIRMPIAAFFITFFIGVPLMLLLGGHLISENTSPWLQFSTGGILEETIKVLPVVIYLLCFRGKASLKMAFSIGFLSSVGLFAAKILSSELLPTGALYPIFLLSDTMVAYIPVFQKDIPTLAVFPLFSLLIVHIIWTAIFTYFLFCAARAGIRGFPFALIGLAVTALLHVTYVALCNHNLPGIATVLVAGSFVLFYCYLTQIRRQIVQSA